MTDERGPRVKKFWVFLRGGHSDAQSDDPKVKQSNMNQGWLIDLRIREVHPKVVVAIKPGIS